MQDIFVEDFQSELFTGAFRKYFTEISTSSRNWEMLFRQMNAERETTKAIMRLDGNDVVGFVMFCTIELSCVFFSESFGYIRELWVDVPYRRLGHGGQLLGLAERYFADRGISQMALNATSAAEAFYLGTGYRESDAIFSQGKALLTKKIIPGKNVI
jgi:ribosomal protein S18 acetylase RimI-like enzyme